MSGVATKCRTCGDTFLAKQTYINHGRVPKYCSRPCCSVSKRHHRSIANKKELKRLYDIRYRARRRDSLLTEKRDYYRANRDRLLSKMAVYRQTPAYKVRRRAYLSGYWNPEKKSVKKDYDRKFGAQKKYGPLWEIHYLTVLLNEEIKYRMSNYEIRLHNKTNNKAQRRARNGEVKRGYA